MDYVYQLGFSKPSRSFSKKILLWDKYQWNIVKLMVRPS